MSARRWVSPDGHTVRLITLSMTGKGRDGDWLVIRSPWGNTIGEIRDSEAARDWLTRELGGLREMPSPAGGG